jgi:hypothetical protein
MVTGSRKMVVEHTFEVMRPHWTPRDHNFKIFQVQPDCLSENFHILGASILSGWQFFQAIRNFDRKKNWMDKLPDLLVVIGGQLDLVLRLLF